MLRRGRGFCHGADGEQGQCDGAGAVRWRGAWLAEWNGARGAIGRSKCSIQERQERQERDADGHHENGQDLDERGAGGLG